MTAFFALSLLAMTFSQARAVEPAATPASVAAPSATPKPSLIHRLLHPFEHPAKPAPAATPAPAPAPAPAESTPKPGFFHWVLHPFGLGDEKKPHEALTPDIKRAKDLQLSMTLDPSTVQLAVNREIKVTLRLTNRGRHLTQLKFATTQRAEAKITDKFGKTIAQWSETQLFDNTPSYVSINPNERAEYVMSVPTRDLQAGELYEVTAGIVGYSDLLIEKTISPVK
ncbi:MAG: BsuPI-related putative proteinase inhibitor [Chthoniobacteraceae bacterium]